MKIVAFVGSPRKRGNISTVVGSLLRGAESAGAETKLYHLNEMNIRPCQGCMYCREHGFCPVKDDMQSIYSDIKDADAVVIGSPVYVCQVSAQTKLMLDRFYPLTDKQHKPRFGVRQTVMVYSHAVPFSIFFMRYFRYTEKWLKPMGLKVRKRLIATKAFTPDAAAGNKKLLEKAFRAGVQLASG